MKRKTRNILFGLIIPVLVIGGILYFQLPRNISNQEPYTSGQEKQVAPVQNVAVEADWVDHFNSVTSLVDNASMVIQGKVVDSYTEQRVDMIFTKQIIEITKVYTGDIKVGDKVEVLQTGGEMNGIKTPTFDEAPLMANGSTYLLFLEHTNEGHYLVAGGYQGRADINKDQVTFSKENYEVGKQFKGNSNSLSAESSSDTSNSNSPVSITTSITNVEAVLATAKEQLKGTSTDLLN